MTPAQVSDLIRQHHQFDREGGFTEAHNRRPQATSIDTIKQRRRRRIEHERLRRLTRMYGR